MSIHVHLERFEGPLALLLYLIRQEEMDIFDINIHQITRQYLEYIKAMRKLDLEVAGEFVAMAATLLHIKSRMLLPQYEGEEGGEAPEDPRKELVQRLVEYQKIQELSKQLYDRPLLGRDVFARGECEDFEALEEGEVVVDENPLFSLIAAYRHALKNMKKTLHRVVGDLQSIASRILEMKDRIVIGQRIGFNQLLTETGPGASGQVLVTFLSLLELARMNLISVFQSEPFAEIHVEGRRRIEGDVVSRVENFDNVGAEAKAEALIENAQLSLQEVETEEGAERAPVANEWATDAATDDEILAEENRILSEEANGETKEQEHEQKQEPTEQEPSL
jgi:segregation and condensation protein A